MTGLRNPQQRLARFFWVRSALLSHNRPKRWLWWIWYFNQLSSFVIILNSKIGKLSITLEYTWTFYSKSLMFRIHIYLLNILKIILGSNIFACFWIRFSYFVFTIRFYRIGIFEISNCYLTATPRKAQFVCLSGSPEILVIDSARFNALSCCCYFAGFIPHSCTHTHT